MYKYCLIFSQQEHKFEPNCKKIFDLFIYFQFDRFLVFFMGLTIYNNLIQF